MWKKKGTRPTLKLALWAEWLWSQGFRLMDLSLQSRVAELYFNQLQMEFPNTRTDRLLGMAEIQHDLHRISLKLSYGGRLPSTLPVIRKNYLEKHDHVLELQQKLLSFRH